VSSISQLEAESNKEIKASIEGKNGQKAQEKSGIPGQKESFTANNQNEEDFSKEPVIEVCHSILLYSTMILNLTLTLTLTLTPAPNPNPKSDRNHKPVSSPHRKRYTC